MIVTMSNPLPRMRLGCVAALLLIAAPVASAQNIYKCTQAGRIEYTDHPCAGAKGQLIHQADDSEILDQYLDLGQDALARRYADAHHLDALYRQRREAYRQRMQARAAQQAAQALADQRRQQASRQQAQVDEAANRGRLQGENDALRQQIDQYRDQQAQSSYRNVPAYYGAPAYWNPGYGHEHEQHDHDQPGPPPQPVFHPCTQLAGGRVQC